MKPSSSKGCVKVMCLRCGTVALGRVAIRPPPSGLLEQLVEQNAHLSGMQPAHTIVLPDGWTNDATSAHGFLPLCPGCRPN